MLAIYCRAKSGGHQGVEMMPQKGQTGTKKQLEINNSDMKTAPGITPGAVFVVS